MWDTAGADSRLTLLPDDEAPRLFPAVPHLGERFREYQKLEEEAGARRRAFEEQFADIGAPTTPVLARMSAANLMHHYDALVKQRFESTLLVKSRLRDFYGVNEAHRQGLFDGASIGRGLREADIRFADDYGKMAREVAAEDAARDKAAGTPTEKGAR